MSWFSGLEWRDLALLLAAIHLLAAVWCAHDAFEHTDHGWIWLVLLVMFFPLTVYVYIPMAVYSRVMPARREAKRLLAEPPSDKPFSMFPTEIEKARFIEAASRGPGTMYSPERSNSVSAQGHPHFTDQRAEDLLAEAGRGGSTLDRTRYDLAWEYLLDLYTIARSETDPLREDTYRHYISRIPGGLEKLEQWEGGARKSDAAQSAPPPANRSSPF